MPIFTPRKNVGEVVEFVEFEEVGFGAVPLDDVGEVVVVGENGVPVPLAYGTVGMVPDGAIIKGTTPEGEIPEGTEAEGIEATGQKPGALLAEAVNATGAVLSREKLRLNEGLGLGSAKYICVSVVVVA